MDRETIAAIATPPGKGGVGIIRLSGPKALEIGQALTGISLTPRKASFAKFKDDKGKTIDTGLALFFSNPHSFTGEDVVEIQGHGGPIILDLLIKRVLDLGARPARAGEFSERAFHNNKIDLAQAEAIADLINSTTEQAAKGAVRSLQGDFSKHVSALLEQLVYLRVYVEAALDFPDEEIDFLADEKIRNSIDALQQSLRETISKANQGAILRNGFKLVIAGKPNAGKSSLLNALSGQDTAIVTDIEGTTRDTISCTIDIDGLPVHIMDTAGLRESTDKVEKIGIERAKKAIVEADHVLLLVDAREKQSNEEQEVLSNLLGFTVESRTIAITKVFNKADLLQDQKAYSLDGKAVLISAKTGLGLNQLRQKIKAIAGYIDSGESIFTARRRHLNALEKAADSAKQGLEQLVTYNAPELLAQELLTAQEALNEITGEFTSDDLLGEIFSGFCIGK